MFSHTPGVETIVSAELNAQYLVPIIESKSNTSLRKQINVSNFLEQRNPRQETILAIWHDVLNNSLTMRKCNAYTELEAIQLASFLLKYKE